MLLPSSRGTQEQQELQLARARKHKHTKRTAPYYAPATSEVK